MTELLFVSKSKVIAWLIQEVFLCIGLCVWVFFSRGDNFSDYLKYLVIFQFFLCVFSNYLVNRWLYNVYGIFLILFFIFLLSRVFLDVVGLYAMEKTSFFSSYYFSEDVVCKTLYSLIVSLVSLNVGFLINSKDSIHYVMSSGKISRDPNYIKFGTIFFIIGAVPTVVKSVLTIYRVSKYGYLSLFVSPELFEIPIYISFFSLFFPIGFLMCHLGKMEGIKLTLITIIFISSEILELLVGKRGAVLTQIIILIWFFAFYYGKLIQPRKLIMFSLLLVLVSQFMLVFRGSKSLPIEELAPLFFYQQGVSVQVIGYMYRYDIADKDEFSPSDVFRPIYQNLDVFIGKFDQDAAPLGPEERMKKYNNYSMVISYEADPGKFSKGFGMGGTYIVEIILLFGYYALPIFNFFLGFFLARIESIVYGKRIRHIIAMMVLPNIIYISRGYIFDFVNTEMRPIMMFGIIMMILHLLQKKQYEKNRLYIA